MGWLDTAVQFVNIMGFAGGVFTYVFLRPLNANFASLKESIDKLANKFDRIEERQRHLEEKLIEVEQRARSAHHRIDEIKTSLG